jgi:flagellar protein FliO/FliZ
MTPDIPPVLQALVALLALVAMIALLALLARSAGRFPRPPRRRRILAIEDVISLDARRRLLAIRCDTRALLLVTGGNRDLVVGWLDESVPGTGRPVEEPPAIVAARPVLSNARPPMS